MNPYNDDIDVDIDNAWYMLKTGKGSAAYSPVYPFTNENLRGYLPQFDVAGKSVLTVAASGDHFLNLALAGAESITTYDINKIAYYWQELKKAGVLTLSPSAFKNFFSQSKSREDFFQPESYREVREGLSAEARHFWDSVSEFAPTKKRLFRDCAVSAVYESAGFYKKSNLYLDDNNYFLLRGKLSKTATRFLHCDIKELPDKTSEKYDAIFTSNICDYAGADYRNFVERRLPACMNRAGFAQVFHRYSGVPDKVDEPQRIDMHYEVRTFPNLRSPNGQGSVVSLHKD